MLHQKQNQNNPHPPNKTTNTKPRRARDFWLVVTELGLAAGLRAPVSQRCYTRLTSGTRASQGLQSVHALHCLEISELWPTPPEMDRM